MSSYTALLAKYKDTLRTYLENCTESLEFYSRSKPKRLHMLKFQIPKSKCIINFIARKKGHFGLGFDSAPGLSCVRVTLFGIVFIYYLLEYVVIRPQLIVLSLLSLNSLLYDTQKPLFMNNSYSYP